MKDKLPYVVIGILLALVLKLVLRVAWLELVVVVLVALVLLVLFRTARGRHRGR